MYYDYFESYYIILVRVLMLAVKANGADLVGITLLNIAKFGEETQDIGSTTLALLARNDFLKLFYFSLILIQIR